MALDTTLKETGLSLTELFDSAIDEITADPLISETEKVDHLTTLAELEDAQSVFTRLRSVDWSFTNADTGYLSHDIHPYPAKFIPQIPRNLITRLSLRGETVFDPFGGSGTTALESLLLGRCPISTDVNPLAKVIGKAKTLTLVKEEDDELIHLINELGILSSKPDVFNSEVASRQGDAAFSIPEIPNLFDWFHQNAITELVYIRWRIRNLNFENARALATAAFSKSILKASYQDEETRYASRPREIPIGSVIRLYAGNLLIALKKIRKLGQELGFREAIFKTVDFRSSTAVVTEGAGPESLNQNSIDLIVTSPPYPNATDYHLYHRFRLFWLGFDPKGLGEKEIGSHLRHQKEATGFESYLEEMALCLNNMLRVLRPGRYAVLVLGDAIFKKETYHTAEQVGQTAQRVGFQLVGMIDRAVHPTKRSFVSAGRRLRSEKLLVLRKPPCNVTFTLLKPPYKMWDYEEDLRKREIKALMDITPRLTRDSHLRMTGSALLLDKLRRLTFTHGFQAPEINKELTWQAIIENGEAFIPRSQRKDPKYATHGLHTYKGKFYPQLVKSLFNLAQLEPGQRILDVFCGSGTVLLESFLNGFTSYGIDLNPLAAMIARVKTEILSVDPFLLNRYLSRFQDQLKGMEVSDTWISFFHEDVQSELLSWFPRPVLAKLGRLLSEIKEVSEPSIRDFLKVIASSIVRDISQQDPQDLRIRRRSTPLTDAPVYELYSQRLGELRTRLQHFAIRSTRAPVFFRPAQAIRGDCRLPTVYNDNGIQRGSIDAAITSPPYATALPYIDTDRLSILLLFQLNSKERSILEASLIGTRELKNGRKAEIDDLIDAGQLDQIRSKTARSIISEVRRNNVASGGGFRKQNTAALLYIYFRDMSVVMENINQQLRAGASAFFVIGNNKTVAGDTEINITSGRALQEIGTSIGWELVDVIPITVTKENRRHSKNSITKNEIVWFRKSN